MAEGQATLHDPPVCPSFRLYCLGGGENLGQHLSDLTVGGDSHHGGLSAVNLDVANGSAGLDLGRTSGDALDLGEVLLGHQAISLGSSLLVGGVLSGDAQTSDVLLGDGSHSGHVAQLIHSHLVEAARSGGVRGVGVVIRALCDAVKSLGLHDLTAVVGMLRDKDCLPVLRMMAPYCARMIITTVPNPRSCPAEEFAELARGVCRDITICPNCEEAARLALATAGEHGVLVFGSLYLASAVRPVMMEALKKN